MRKNLRTSIFALAFLVGFPAFSQVEENTLSNDVAIVKNEAAKPEHQKRTFQDDDDKIYWQVDLPAFVSISPTPATEDGYKMKTVKTQGMKEHANPMYFDGHGVHYIRHFDYEHNVPEQQVAFEVFVDGIAPVTSLTFSKAPRYATRSVVYYGKGLTTTLASKDEMSGLEQTLHSVNGQAFSKYSSTVDFKEEGTFTYQYYAVDRVGNVEKDKNVAFTVDLTAPTTTHTVNGDQLDNILSPRANIKLTSQDELSGVNYIKWAVDDKGNNTYKTALWFSYLQDGEHTLTYTATDRVKNQEETKTYSFYLDKIAPEITTAIEGDMYNKGGRNYISERSKVKLTATDNKAGVKEIRYSLDGKTLQTYTSEFLLDVSQGLHAIRTTATDKVENKSTLKADQLLGNLYMDLTPPKINHYYTGAQFFTRDTMFITEETKVKLNAVDYQSGLQKIEYDLDGTKNTFNDPFTISPDGLHKVQYTGFDNVNNTKQDDFFFVVDNEGPEIFHHFSMEKIGVAELEGEDGDVPIYAPHNQLFLAATDVAVGTEKIYYSLDGSAERLYTTPIKGLSKGFRSLTIRATDKLGNETKAENIVFMIK